MDEHASAEVRARLTPRGDAKTLRQDRGLQFCWLTGLTESAKPDWWYGPWYLQLAHLAAGSGKMIHRVDDRRMVVLLSPLAHALHVHRSQGRMRINGKELPVITNANVLWIKMRINPMEYDEEFIRHWWVGEPPEPEPTPKEYLEMLEANRGIQL